jgi:hypothetical protein
MLNYMIGLPENWRAFRSIFQEVFNRIEIIDLGPNQVLMAKV